MTNTKKKKQAEQMKEIQHLQKVFGSDLQNYYHSGHERSELPYTVRDAGHKKKGSRQK